MRARAAVLGLIASLASAGFAQTSSGSTSSQTFQLTGGESPQSFLEIINIVRSVAEIRQLTGDASRLTISAQGTVDQLSMASWLIGELDHPARTGAPTYISPGGVDNMVRIYYPAHVESPQQLQELVNVARATTDVARVAVLNSANAMVVAGQQTRVALSDWIVKNLDLAAGQAQPTALAPVVFAPGDVAQVYYLHSSQNPQQTQEIVNIVRSLGQINRVVVFNVLKAIVVRASTAQAAAAEWIVSQLDKPSPPAAAGEVSYLMPGAADGALRVFFLPNISSPQGLQQLVIQIRGAATIQRIVTCNAVKAIAMRGDAGQIAIAEQLVQQSAKM